MDLLEIHPDRREAHRIADVRGAKESNLRDQVSGGRLR